MLRFLDFASLHTHGGEGVSRRQYRYKYYSSEIRNCQSVFRNLFYNFLMSKFGERLKELRRERGITQKQLAEVLEVSKTTICQWETMKQEPSIEMLMKLADLFHTSVDYLVGRKDI